MQREHWQGAINRFSRSIESTSPFKASGRLRRVVGLTLEAVGFEAALGERCWVRDRSGNRLEAEVVGFSGEIVYLMPTQPVRGLSPKARVYPERHILDVPVGPEMLGRVVDGSGNTLDDLGPLNPSHRANLLGEPINPLRREPIELPLDTGIRAINALFTVGRGQRLGLFAGSGVGKSTLLGMMTRYTAADVVVVGLVGERGREVREFIRSSLGEAGLARSIVVASPSDSVPLMRMRAAWLATTIAEYFRDQGQQVLLLMDSLTRFAQARREIALAIGEPPATQGYPPSVFASLPALIERAGTGERGGGSITAFYTILTEGDELKDPVSDAARAVLDGHIVLSRQLAEQGVYPAIEIDSSISRLFDAITGQEQQALARRVRQIVATWRQNQDLILVGAYRKGEDPRIDEAIEYYPKILDFLRQSSDQAIRLDKSFAALKALVGHADSGAGT